MKKLKFFQSSICHWKTLTEIFEFSTQIKRMYALLAALYGIME